MARAKKERHFQRNGVSGSPRPISQEQYVRETRASCKDGRCCSDQAALVAAYERYVNDPRAPWNKGRGRRGFRTTGERH
jgi:hypothetical protein